MRIFSEQHGGNNDFFNLEIAHRSCNSSKHDRTYKEYISSKNRGDLSISKA